MDTNAAFRLCPECAGRGRTCCQGTEIYVTPGDVRRMEPFCGGNLFYEYRAPANPAYADNDEDPVWMTHVFRKDGARRVIRRDPFGNCHFLGSGGCRLDENTRPLICRLFPYEYRADGLLPALADGCPAHLLPEGLTLESALGMDRERAAAWHRTLYAEILEEHPENEDWTHIRLAV